MQDGARIRNTLRVTFKRILTPLARIATKLGFSYADFEQIAKSVFIQAAAGSENKPVNTLSAREQTALTSKIARSLDLDESEVMHELTLPTPFPLPDFNDMMAPGEVLSEWFTNSDYLDTDGQPKPLPFDGEHLSFCALTNFIESKSMPSIAILRELLAAKAVVQRPDGQLEAKIRSYIPVHSLTELLHRSGQVIRRVIETIENNLGLSGQEPFVERSCMGLRIPREAVPELLDYARQFADTHINNLDDHITQYDVPANQASNETLLEVGMGIYFFAAEKQS